VFNPSKGLTNKFDGGKERKGAFYEEKQNFGSRLDCPTDGGRIGFGKL